MENRHQYKSVVGVNNVGQKGNAFDNKDATTINCSVLYVSKSKEEYSASFSVTEWPICLEIEVGPDVLSISDIHKTLCN
jgi:hypothetical protein